MCPYTIYGTHSQVHVVWLNTSLKTSHKHLVHLFKWATHQQLGTGFPQMLLKQEEIEHLLVAIFGCRSIHICASECLQQQVGVCWTESKWTAVFVFMVMKEQTTRQISDPRSIKCHSESGFLLLNSGANPSSPGGSSWLKSHNNGSTYGKGVRCTVFVDNSICIRLVNEKGCKLKCIILSVTSCVSPLFYIIYICKAALLRVYLCELGTPFCYKLLYVVHLECSEVASWKLGNSNLWCWLECSKICARLW